MKTIKLTLAFLLSATLLGCGGGGGGSSTPSGGPIRYEDSWPIYAALVPGSSSYANKNDTRIVRSQIDDVRALGITLDANETNSVASSLTLGDFYQEGQLSAFVVVNRGVGQMGKVYFLRWKDDSKWVDDTTRLLSNRNACVSSQYAVTADFNHDGKPDVFLSCGGGSEEEQLVFLSSSTSNSYSRISTGVVIKGNRAAASDLDGDLYPDVVLSNKDGVSNPSTIVVLKGSGDGKFVNPLTSWLTNCTNSSGSFTPPEIPVKVDQVFLVPTTGGRTDLIVSGESGAGAKNQMWFRNQGRAPYFTNCENTATAAKLFSASLVSSSDAVLTDVFYSTLSGTSSLYAYMQTSNGSVAGLQKFVIQNDATLNLNLLSNVFAAPAQPSSGFPSMFRLNSANQLIPVDAGCGGTASGTRCGLTFTLQ
jgi:hypothetical protein